MRPFDWHWIKGVPRLLATARAEPVRQAERIVAMQLHVVLPAKIAVAAFALYYLFSGSFPGERSVYVVVLEALQKYILIYILCNFAAGVVFFLWRRLPAGLFQWLVFTLGLLDGLFMAGLTFMTGGFESMAYWMFAGLIVLNAVSIPLAVPQIVLNLLLSVFYLGAGILDARVPLPVLWAPPPSAFRSPGGPRTEGRGNSTNEASLVQDTNRLARTNRPARSPVSDLPYSTPAEENAIEPFLPRLFVLWLLTACCYGVQVLAERQRRVVEEAHEFGVREGQLRSAGRLAAEFAHQIKNPLAIINNAAFSLQRGFKTGKTDATKQLEIIQEEVARADQIITQIVGYAQLAEGRVEKVNVSEELDRAVAQMFPPAVPGGIKVHCHFARHFPPLLIQRRHFSETLANLLQNAREALNGQGNVFVTAGCLPDDSVEISVRDDGPGIPADRFEQIFEAYFTTKERGTGLGLAIVKHNVELYDGSVRVQSELGKGAEFTVVFPAKSLMKLAK